MHPATLWEAIRDVIPDAHAIVQGATVRTWGKFEDNAARLATTLQAAGIGEGSKVALYLYNGPEYLEASFAAYKVRAVPVNVNYRYEAGELAYLLDNCDAEVLIFDAALADRVAAVLRPARLGTLIEVGDTAEGAIAGAVGWRDALEAAPAPRIERSEADLHVLYTGGTTGLPKGVLYELGGLVRELLASGAPVLGSTVPSSVDEVAVMAAKAIADDRQLITLVLPPLMHGTGMALAMITLLCGGTTVLADGTGLDPAAALATVAERRVQVLSLVGDAFGRPLVDALAAAEAEGTPADVSSLRVIMSSGAMLSAPVKEALLARATNAMIIDTLAASEAPMGGSITVAGAPASTASFALRPGTQVFDDHDQPVPPGSDMVGRVGVATDNPIGYYKDSEKTAATFRVIDGVRYSFPGDWARVEPDGTVTLLGRGSHCINTGGEKVFPEEVEETLKTHPAVIDALVFGVDDDRWGQRIEAVTSVTEPVDTTALIDHVRSLLAAYKAPKAIHVVDLVPRAPNGKADYTAARRLALEAGTLP